MTNWVLFSINSVDCEFFVLNKIIYYYIIFLLYAYFGIILYHTHIVKLILIGLVALWVMQEPGCEKGRRMCWNF